MTSMTVAVARCRWTITSLGTIVDADGIRPDGTFINPVYQTTTHYGKYPMLSGGANDGLGPHGTYYQSSRGLTEVSFCKVKNITLGYTFASSLLKKISCQNLRLYFTVTNPFVWSKYRASTPNGQALLRKTTARVLFPTRLVLTSNSNPFDLLTIQ